MHPCIVQSLEHRHRGMHGAMRSVPVRWEALFNKTVRTIYLSPCRNASFSLLA